MNTKSVPLPIAIKLGEKKVKAIDLREPMSGELRGLKLADLMQMDVSAMITLIPRISNPPLSEADVGELKPANLTALAAGMMTFFVDPADLPKDA